MIVGGFISYQVVWFWFFIMKGREYLFFFLLLNAVKSTAKINTIGFFYIGYFYLSKEFPTLVKRDTEIVRYRSPL